MKIRNGFVSNSSSSSFILRWKMHYDKDVSIDYALKRLFDFSEPEIAALSEEIKNKTKKIDENTFETRWWTCMRNSFSDFGVDAMVLYSMLKFEDEMFEILKEKEEFD